MDHFVIDPGRKITGASTEHRTDDVGIDRRQPAGEGTPARTDDVHGVPDDERPVHTERPGGQQAVRTFGQRPLRTGVDMHRTHHLGGEGDPQLARRQGAIVRLERRADEFRGHGAGEHIGSRRAGDHRTHPRPRRHPRSGQLRRHAATSPSAATGVGPDGEQRVTGAHQRDQRRRRIAARIGGVHAVHVGQQHEHVGADTVRDQGSEPIVVAVPQLVVGDGVVLVDHRHTTQLQQPVDGVAGVQVLGAVGEVVWIEQDLGADDAMAGELPVVRLDQTALARRGDRLQRLHVGRPRRQTQRRHPGGDRPRRHHDHLVPTGAQRCHLVGELGQRPGIDGATLVGDRRGADLCDHSHDNDP